MHRYRLGVSDRVSIRRQGHKGPLFERVESSFIQPGSLERALIERAWLAYEAALALLPPAPESVPVEPSIDGEPKPLAEMSLTELRAFAAANNIDISGASKKDEVLTKISEANPA